MKRQPTALTNPDSLPHATIVFLIKRYGRSIPKICLANKKRGFGKGKLNGFGGKVKSDEGESVETAACREACEESTVHIQIADLRKVAEITFLFPHRPHWGQQVHVFLTEKWTGDPSETEEMLPAWYFVSKIPYSSMWASDRYWLPKVLAGTRIEATFTFGDNEKILEHDVRSV